MDRDARADPQDEVSHLTSVVIVGAAMPGSGRGVLARAGFDGEIVLLSAEKDPPYQRPPLSKAFLKGEMDIHGLPLRADAHFREQRIDLRLGVGATRIDRACAAGGAQRRRRDRLRPSHPRDWRAATAARCARRRSAGRVRAPRHRRRDRDPRAPWRQAQGRHHRRRIHRARDRRDRREPRGRGDGGRDRAPDGPGGLADHVGFFPERARRLSARASGSALGVAAIKGREHAETVILTDGEELSADLVVVGIGVVAEDALARECGLECDNGIVVDEFLLSSDSTISAIGDCTAFPHAALGMRTRLESVQNAVDQGRSVAARLMGKPKPYNELAWFWSDQGDLKLMIAGLAHGVSTWVVRGDPATRAFSTFGFRDGKLAVVESVNEAGDHAAAKRIIGTTKTLTPEEAADPAFDLRGLAKR